MIVALWLTLTSCLLPVSIDLNCCGFSSNQFSALNALYNATNGLYWHWRLDFETYGVPWSFSVFLLNFEFVISSIHFTTNRWSWSQSILWQASWISESLFALSTIQYLAVDFDMFTGSILPTNSGLQSAEALFFSKNPLTDHFQSIYAIYKLSKS